MASVKGAGMVQAAPKEKMPVSKNRSAQKSGDKDFSAILGRLKKSPRSGGELVKIPGPKGRIIKKAFAAESAEIKLNKKSKGILVSEERDLLQDILKKSAGKGLDNLKKRALKALDEEKAPSREELMAQIGELIPKGEIKPVNNPELQSSERITSEELPERTKAAEVPKKVELEITVQDLRTEKEPQKKSKDIHSTVKEALKKEVDRQEMSRLNPEVQKQNTTAFNKHSEADKDLLNELKSPDGITYSPQGSGGKVEIPVGRQAAQSFQDHLTRSGNADIVRNMKVILKDHNAGEIKLILKPESLGNVRIQLSMNENNVVGKIVVDNQSIRDVFQNNMNTLNQILKDNGFENASLDVFVGGEQGQNPQSAEEALEDWEARKNADSLRKLDEAATVAVNGMSVPEGGLNLIV